LGWVEKRNPTIGKNIDATKMVVGFNGDGDMGSTDLAIFAAGGAGITLEEFAADFGRIYCA
jgi:hypothetical protein